MKSFYQPYNILKEKKKLILLLLNMPINIDTNLFSFLWNNATLRMCCDGGTNRLYDFVMANKNMERIFPDFICGDFDSMRDDTKEYFIKKGSSLKYLPDQDFTDFQKTVKFGIGYCIEKQIEFDAIVVYPAMGGRLDQMLSNINTLYQVQSLTQIPCYLMSDIDITFLVNKGETVVEVGNENKKKFSCGLVPIGCAAEKVTTNGLLYNLDGQSMAFGSLISTSNSLVEKSITIETSHPLLMTMSYVDS